MKLNLSAAAEPTPVALIYINIGIYDGESNLKRRLTAPAILN